MTPTLFDQLADRTASQRIDSARLAARSDPRTSHAAAAAVAAEDIPTKQARVVASAVRRYPGRTTADLAKLTGLDRHMLGKRASVAEALGLIRRGERVISESTGKPGETWWPGGGV